MRNIDQFDDPRGMTGHFGLGNLNLGEHQYGYESIPTINTIFSGMNIYLPAIFMFTRGTRFWPTAI